MGDFKKHTQNLTFERAQPKFLQQMQAKIQGEEDEKRKTQRKTRGLPEDGEDGEGNAEDLDDAPQVVVLRKGDLTAEEVETMRKNGEVEADGKMVFKKPPVKKQKISEPGAKEDRDEKEQDRKSKEKPTGPKAKAKLSLLSFGEDEE